MVMGKETPKTAAKASVKSRSMVSSPKLNPQTTSSTPSEKFSPQKPSRLEKQPISLNSPSKVQKRLSDFKPVEIEYLSEEEDGFSQQSEQLDRDSRELENRATILVA